jgi:hypothetical protein
MWRHGARRFTKVSRAARWASAFAPAVGVEAGGAAKIAVDSHLGVPVAEERRDLPNPEALHEHVVQLVSAPQPTISLPTSTAGGWRNDWLISPPPA